MSHKTFIYDIKGDSWIEGPPLLTARASHFCCVIQLDDRSTHCIVIGGETEHEGKYSKSTEIFNFSDQKWVKGPSLPCGINSLACVAAPRLHKFACLLVGGDTEETKNSQNVYGLSKNLSEWKLLGKIKKGRHDHIAIPLDYIN